MRPGRLAPPASGAYSIASEPPRVAPVLAGRLAVFSGTRARSIQPAGQEQETQAGNASQRSGRGSPPKAGGDQPRPGGGPPGERGPGASGAQHEAPQCQAG